MNDNNNYVTASLNTLVRQAPMTAAEYLREAIKEIDELLGVGYAAKHPQLITAVITAASSDFHTCMLKIAAQDLTHVIEEAIVAILTHLEGDNE